MEAADLAVIAGLSRFHIGCESRRYTLAFDIAENSNRILPVRAQARFNSRGIDDERD
jgi:hypothetical protein